MSSGLSDFEALIARLAAIDFSQTSEQATREMAVNPVIARLGWDTFNPMEVDREHSVRGGRVDYCLRSPERKLVLIEVKRAGTDLEEHQEQLLRYAFEEGVPLAALTDGLVWWLYLSTAQVSWEQRRFFHIDLRDHEPACVAMALGRFLNRDAVVGGGALEEAKQEFDSRERERRVRAALREAWNRVLSDPHGQLRALLAEAVEEISGHVPDQEVLGEFLLGIARSGTTEFASPFPPRRGERPSPAGQGDTSAAEPTDETEDETIFVTAAFARRVLTRRQLSSSMKTVLRVLLDAHPDWLPEPALHRAAGYGRPAQFAGLMGGFGKRMANTEDYDREANFFEYRWNEDEDVWEYRLPDTVREALTLEGLV